VEPAAPSSAWKYTSEIHVSNLAIEWCARADPVDTNVARIASHAMCRFMSIASMSL
jgi:hypothetical protein